MTNTITGQYNATPPTVGDKQYGGLQIDAAGNLKVAGSATGASASQVQGTAAHTLTLTGGTWNGTNTVATLDAPAKFLCVWFDSAGAGTVIVNVGSVGLS